MKLSADVEKEMRERARTVKERMASGNFTPEWSLVGKNSVVEPGRDVIARLCPRWDYAQSMIRQGEKLAPNPDYAGGAIFVVAFEHWWEAGDGKTTREWCPRSLDYEAVCPICMASTAMVASAAKDDRDFGKRIQAREVFIFNAVVGRPRRLTKEGRADIRILKAGGTVFSAISDIMTGGAESSFARGDISHPREGFDLKLTRPVAGGGDRWKVDCAPGASQLYEADQAAAFKGWPSLLLDLEAMLQKEVKSPHDIFLAFYGREPEAGEMTSGAPPSPNGASGGDSEEFVPATLPATQPVAPDDDYDQFMPPPPAGSRESPKPAGATRAATSTKPPVPPRPVGRPGPRGGRR